MKIPSAERLNLLMLYIKHMQRPVSINGIAREIISPMRARELNGPSRKFLMISNGISLMSTRMHSVIT